MFHITDKPISTASCLNDLNDSSAGALVIFEGIVRDHNDGQPVCALEYDACAAMAEKEAQKIIDEACRRFAIHRAAGVHRIGRLAIGDVAVWIGVTAAHRDAAYLASRYIIDEIKIRLPIWKKEHYENGVSQWINCQTHQPAASIEIRETSHDLSKTEQDYYSRQIRLASVGEEGQKKLRAGRVLVVGAGGLGSQALLHLAAAGVGTIGICEYDTLEIHNLHRQTLYSFADQGRAKAQLAQERLRALNPLINVQIHPEKLTAANVVDIFKTCDVCIDGTDHLATKFLLNDAAVLYKKPLIQSSIHQFEGEIHFYQPEDEQASCLRCGWSQIPPQECIETCEQAGVLGVVAGFFGTWQAAEAIKYLLGLPVIAANETLLMDLFSYDIKKIRQPRNPRCLVCGSEATISTIADFNYHGQSEYELTSADIDSPLYRDLVVLDIRSADEFIKETNPLSSVVNIPGEKILNGEFPLNAAKRYLMVCAKGIRSHKLTLTLRGRNLINAFSLKGGIQALKNL